MKKAGSGSKVKYLIIIGYILLIAVMITGLVSVFRNLVDFSEKSSPRDNDVFQLIVVGNTISKLYEIESYQNLLNTNPRAYFQLYDSILPGVIKNIDTLKFLSKDPVRNAKLDTIKLLMDSKEKNLRDVSSVMLSLSQFTPERREKQNLQTSEVVNENIRQYIEKQSQVTPEINTVDTVVIKSEKKGFFDRVRNVFSPKTQDSTVIIKEVKQEGLNPEPFNPMIDSVVDIIKNSEQVDLQRQRNLQNTLLKRSHSMIQTNILITSRINDLLKEIESEELQKSITWITNKNETLDESQKLVTLISLVAVSIALIFGVLMLVDVNKSSRYRRKLEESNEKISHLLDSRERLMLSISHDIKAPMSSILGYIELMSRPIDPEKKVVFLANMKKSSEHVLQLVMNLLDFHKLEFRKWVRKESNFNVYSVVENTSSSFKPLAAQKGLELNIENRIEQGFIAFGDPYMLRQIISNLISNAIKFTIEGYVEVLADLKKEKNKTFIELSVKDSGVGISKENQQIVFREFHQLSNNLTNDVGSGLGLSIVKGMVEDLGGSIFLNSTEGEGSLFTVTIPVKPESPELIKTAGSENKEYDFSGLRILLVDDDPLQLTMTEEILKRKNAIVTSEMNPAKVLNIICNEEFDIIFIDIQMPVMNGFELVNLIRNSDVDYSQSVPIIALSAKSDVTVSDFQEAGFSLFLTKPFSGDQLFSIILKFTNNDNQLLTGEFTDKHSYYSTVKGVKALIEFVKDDKVTSIQILQSFVNDLDSNIYLMNDAFERADYDTLSKLSHKMLPLFRMIDDKELIGYLSDLESEKSIEQGKFEQLSRLLKVHLQDAKKLTEELNDCA